MTQTHANLLWVQPEWIDQAHDWIKRALVEIGYTLTGPIEQLHSRVWSTVMRCPTQSGIVYFKACQRPTEARLTQYLGRIQADNIPHLLAVDLQQGWMLMRDEGPMLREFLKSPTDLQMLEPALVRFAELQIQVVGEVANQPGQFFAMGAQDRRLDRLPRMFADLLDEPEILRLGFEDGITEEQHRRLRASLPRYQEMCSQLQTYAVPQTLFHDDFHDGNIFVSGPPSQHRFVFSDWDESCLGHPFTSIMLCLRSVSWRAGFPDEATEAPERMPDELNRLRDVYLLPWRRYENPAQLLEVFNLAWRVGMVSRALSWRAYISALEAPRRVDLTYIVPAWLQEYLLAMP